MNKLPGAGLPAKPKFPLTIHKGCRLIPARAMTDHVRRAELPIPNLS